MLHASAIEPPTVGPSGAGCSAWIQYVVCRKRKCIVCSSHNAGNEDVWAENAESRKSGATIQGKNTQRAKVSVSLASMSCQVHFGVTLI